MDTNDDRAKSNSSQRFIYDKQTSTITIDNLTELSLEELKEFQETHNVGTIVVRDSNKSDFFDEISTTFSVDEYREVLAKVAEFSKGLDKPNITSEEKFLILYSRLTQSVVYDYPAAYPKTPQEEEYAKNVENDCRNIKNFFLEGKCVCAGFAQGLYQLCMVNGIDARFIPGRVCSVYHAWNQVKLGDTWIDVDPTWDATDIRGDLAYIENIGQSREEFWKNHEVLSTMHMLENKEYNAVGEFDLDGFLSREFDLPFDSYTPHDRAWLLDLLDSNLAQGLDISLFITNFRNEKIEDEKNYSSLYKNFKRENVPQYFSRNRLAKNSFKLSLGHDAEYFIKRYGLDEHLVRDLEEEFNASKKFIKLLEGMERLLQDAGYTTQQFDLIETFDIPLENLKDENVSRDEYIYNILEDDNISKEDILLFYQKLGAASCYLRRVFLNEIYLHREEAFEAIDKNVQNQELMAEYTKYPPEIRDVFFEEVAYGKMLPENALTMLKYNQGRATEEELAHAKEQMEDLKKIKYIENDQNISFKTLNEKFGITQEEFLAKVDVLFKMNIKEVVKTDYNNLEYRAILTNVERKFGKPVEEIQSHYRLTLGQLVLLGQDFRDKDGNEVNTEDILEVFSPSQARQDISHFQRRFNFSAKDVSNVLGGVKSSEFLVAFETYQKEIFEGLGKKEGGENSLSFLQKMYGVTIEDFMKMYKEGEYTNESFASRYSDLTFSKMREVTDFFDEQGISFDEYESLFDIKNPTITYKEVIDIIHADDAQEEKMSKQDKGRILRELIECRTKEKIEDVKEVDEPEIKRNVTFEEIGRYIIPQDLSISDTVNSFVASQIKLQRDIFDLVNK